VSHIYLLRTLRVLYNYCQRSALPQVGALKTVCSVVMPKRNMII